MPQPGEYQLRVAKASDPNMYIGYVTGNGFDQGALTTVCHHAQLFCWSSLDLWLGREPSTYLRITLQL